MFGSGRLETIHPKHPHISWEGIDRNDFELCSIVQGILSQLDTRKIKSR